MLGLRGALGARTVRERASSREQRLASEAELGRGISAAAWRPRQPER
jgi:hypothetical protein